MCSTFCNFTSISSSAFGKLNEPIFSSDYITNKKSKIIFYNQIKKVSFNNQPSYETFNLFNRTFKDFRETKSLLSSVTYDPTANSSCTTCNNGTCTTCTTCINSNCINGDGLFINPFIKVNPLLLDSNLYRVVDLNEIPVVTNIITNVSPTYIQPLNKPFYFYYKTLQ